MPYNEYNISPFFLAVKDVFHMNSFLIHATLVHNNTKNVSGSYFDKYKRKYGC